VEFIPSTKLYCNQKKGVMKTYLYHKSKFCTCDFCNLYPAIQPLLQHINAIDPREHNFLYSTKTLGTTYLSVSFGSLCSICLAIARNSSWYYEYTN
jgi:hypothetical protein